MGTLHNLRFFVVFGVQMRGVAPLACMARPESGQLSKLVDGLPTTLGLTFLGPGLQQSIDPLGQRHGPVGICIGGDPFLDGAPLPASLDFRRA